jgi:hypothetical protein
MCNAHCLFLDDSDIFPASIALTKGTVFTLIRQTTYSVAIITVYKMLRGARKSHFRSDCFLFSSNLISLQHSYDVKKSPFV